MSETGPHATGWTTPPVNWSHPVRRSYRRLSSHVPGLFRSGLDLLITTYTLGLCLIGVTGGVELGVVRAHDAAKPLLVLLLIVPLRVALGGRSWLADVTHTTVRHVAGWWELAAARVPASIADTLFAFVVVKIASVPAAFVANLVFEPDRERGFTLPFQYQKFAEIFAAWDSGWYWHIARHGYYYSPDAQSSIAFFPLYPMLMRAAAAPFGGGDSATWIAGLCISLGAFALALVALHRFTERIFGSRQVARCTVILVAVFPWSLFLTRVYADSLFLLMSVLAVSRAHDGQWRRAGFWGALATLARPNGILIGLPLVLLALRDRPGLREIVSRWIRLIPVPAAMVAYCAYVYTLTGNPLGWMAAQVHWGYSLGHPPWQQLLRMIGELVEYGPYDYFFISDIAPFELLHGIPALIFLALTPAVFRRLGAAMGSYVLVSLLVPLSSNTLEGLGRYASVLFPVFMLAGSMMPPRVYEGIVIVSVVFRTLLVSLFVTWHPVY
jgi:hypothetical protein